VEGIEVDAEAILRKPSASAVNRSPVQIHQKTLSLLEAGKTPVIFTSRKELRFDSANERLAAGETISRFLVDIVRSLPRSPSYLVAKGGITSHNILVDALEVRKARVLGQILPGVPVIRTPEDSRFPDLPYIIFPGNVGDHEALARVHAILASPGDEIDRLL
jgi:uncharacterized protein YgbK (DUF1537 family)